MLGGVQGFKKWKGDVFWWMDKLSRLSSQNHFSCSKLEIIYYLGKNIILIILLSRKNSDETYLPAWKVYCHIFMSARRHGTCGSDTAKSLLLTAFIAARIPIFPCAYSPSPNSHEKTERARLYLHSQCICIATEEPQFKGTQSS